MATPDPVQMVQLEVPDYDLGLRGKLLRPDKLSGPSGIAFCTIVYGLSVADDVTDTSFSNVANGYPDAAVTVDEATRVTLPWRRDTEAVIGDLTGPDGQPFPASPRAALQSLVSDYTRMGLEPIMGFEYEVWLFHDDGQRDLRNMRPFGRTENAYSLTRAAEVAPLAQEFVDRMEHVGAPVEAFHSELGHGAFEFAMKPQPAVAAADGAARARQYFRDLCAERGLLASFMAKPFGDKSGAGGHVHSSLCADGENIFSDGSGVLSETGARYVAGLLTTMGDLAVLFLPFINSFKRPDDERFVAQHPTHGTDDRSAACRLLLDTTSGARVEHRLPGADANPYAVASAILTGGLVGIQDELALAGAGGELPPLPADLPDGIARLEVAERVTAVLGDAFSQAYGATRRSEADRYADWLRTTITDWELSRHLEHQ